ncbi:MAG TPA: NHL repeat-containing protein, partial [Longimicrobium sp.]|nr:NHL repeat-containing protein [Longimicrobium sp.]
AFVPVPNATLQCRHSRPLCDRTLSTATPTTDADGRAVVPVSYDEGEEGTLNPYFVVRIAAEADRRVPAGAPADRRVTLPAEWETRHHARATLRDLHTYTDAAAPLELRIGVRGRVRMARTDWRTGVQHDPLALPRETARVHVADKDVFIWDWLAADDAVTGWGYDPGRRVTEAALDGGPLPYGDPPPVAPYAIDVPPAEALPPAVDPPGAPLGTLGGGSFLHTGAVATDPHGFVFVLDDGGTTPVVRRFYPDGTLAETITAGTRAGSTTFRAPMGIAVDQFRHLFVSEAALGSERVSVWRMDDPQGTVAGTDGRYRHLADVTAPGFSRPMGLAVVPQPVADAPELLAVADPGAGRVRVFRIDVASATWAARFRANPTASVVHVADLSGPELNHPVAVAADREGRLYVCDEAHHGVTRWDPNAGRTAWTFGERWGKAGNASGAGNREFNAPSGVAVDPLNRYLYVADAGNRRVQRLDIGGTPPAGAHLCNWEPAAAPFRPDHVAVDERGEVYVTTVAQARLVRGSPFDADGSHRADGEPPLAVGTPWTDAHDAERMQAPAYVSFGPDGRLWVSDSLNQRVTAWRRGETAWHSTGQTVSGGFSATAGVAVLADGTMFVVDPVSNRVRRFDAALAHAADFGTTGGGDAQLNGPRGIAVLQLNEPVLAVADAGNNRVSLFRRDGTPLARVAGLPGSPFSHPEDVVGVGRHLYVADTGNRRIVHLPVNDDGTVDPGRSFAVPGAAAEPCGVSSFEGGRLLVTDRAAGEVLRFEPDGTVSARWDLLSLLPQDVNRIFQMELARQVMLHRPSRAVMGPDGTVAVADTGHDRVRLLRVHTDALATFTSLDEDLPDLYTTLRTEARPLQGLRAATLDVGWIWDDEPHTLETAVESSFAGDEYLPQLVLGDERKASAALNALRVVRETWRWMAHLTREDEAEHRLGTDRSFRIQCDITGESRSQQTYGTDHVMLKPTARRGEGGVWDEAAIVHEIAHWMFHRSVHPNPPFRISGDSHSAGDMRNGSHAASEGHAQYNELFWPPQYGPSDRVRGYALLGGFGLDNVDVTPDATATLESLYGGAWTLPVPTFTAPGRGLAVEGYFSNTLWQVHHALVDPEIRWADQPQFWWHYNSRLSDAQSRAFSRVLRRALRMFPERPSDAQWQNGSAEWLKQILRATRDFAPGLTRVVQSIYELNNQLMPEIGAAISTAPGTPLGATLNVPAGASRGIVFTLRDGTGEPLSACRLRFAVATADRWDAFAGGGPAALHGGPATGASPTVRYRATDGGGAVEISFNAPPIAGATETITVSYQPDFDADAAFDPPARGDDRETAYRKLYLNQLRAANKLWGGTGNNRGAIVTRTLTLNVTA